MVARQHYGVIAMNRMKRNSIISHLEKVVTDNLDVSRVRKTHAVSEAVFDMTPNHQHIFDSRKCGPHVAAAVNSDVAHEYALEVGTSQALKLVRFFGEFLYCSLNLEVTQTDAKRKAWLNLQHVTPCIRWSVVMIDNAAVTFAAQRSAWVHFKYRTGVCFAECVTTCNVYLACASVVASQKCLVHRSSVFCHLVANSAEPTEVIVTHVFAHPFATISTNDTSPASSPRHMKPYRKTPRKYRRQSVNPDSRTSVRTQRGIVCQQPR